MANEANSGEATPQNNTAKAVNPSGFGELELAKALKGMLSTPEEKPKQDAQPDPAAVAESDNQGESADQTDNNSGTQDESPESDPSQDEQVEAQPAAEETEAEPTGVQKRIDKLTKQKKEAAERAEALERELNEAKAKLAELESKPSVVPVADASNPFGDVWEESKLTSEWEKARQLKRWCEDNQDGAEVNGVEYSKEDVRNIRRKVEDALEVQIPRRAQYLAQYKQVKPIAESIYPWWKDRATAEYTQAQEVLRSIPQIQALPEYQVLIGDFLEGRKLRLARDTKASKPTVGKPLPKVAQRQPGAPTAAPAKVEAKTAQAAVARSKFVKSGGQAELAQLLKSTVLGV